MTHYWKFMGREQNVSHFTPIFVTYDDVRVDSAAEIALRLLGRSALRGQLQDKTWALISLVVNNRIAGKMRVTNREYFTVVLTGNIQQCMFKTSMRFTIGLSRYPELYITPDTPSSHPPTRRRTRPRR